MRDENGFKMHTQSESHVRQMLLVGEDPKKYINDYSSQFQRDFLQLLRTSHGEKQISMNHFYQEYISNKEHIHMNATKWPSLTEFAKFLGREGICRVEETDKGIQIAWIDNSPEALRRQDAIRKKERQDKGDEEREQMLIREQVQKAKLDADARANGEENEAEEERELKRAEGEKIKLSFGKKLNTSALGQNLKIGSDTGVHAIPQTFAAEAAAANPALLVMEPGVVEEAEKEDIDSKDIGLPVKDFPTPPGKVSVKMGIQSKPKNVFAAAKKNALAGKKAAVVEQPKKMSEAERIMKEEIERKRNREAFIPSGSAHKRQRL